MPGASLTIKLTGFSESDERGRSQVYRGHSSSLINTDDLRFLDILLAYIPNGFGVFLNGSAGSFLQLKMSHDILYGKNLSNEKNTR